MITHTLWFCKNVGQLVGRGNFGQFNKTLLKVFIYNMTIYLDMFCTLMAYKVSSYVKGCLVVICKKFDQELEGANIMHKIC